MNWMVFLIIAGYWCLAARWLWWAMLSIGLIGVACGWPITGCCLAVPAAVALLLMYAMMYFMGKTGR